MRDETRVAWIALAAAMLIACDSAPDAPVERVGAPLAVTPRADEDAGTPRADGGRGSSDASHARDGEPTPIAPAARDAAPPRPQPAKALAIAREADEAADRGELAAAERLYGKALGFNPESPWLRTAHGWFLARLGRVADARVELERALDHVDRQDPLLIAAIHHDLGVLRETQRDRARARESYRAALRAWSSPQLARALLRVTSPEDLQYRAALRRAFGDVEIPPSVLAALGPSGVARPRPLAFASAGDTTAIVTSTPPPGTGADVPAGAHYGLRILGPSSSPGGGSGESVEQLALVEARAIRWDAASVEPVRLGADRSGWLVVLERTAPGAGAPVEVGTTLVGATPNGASEVLFTKVTGSERDDPLGCRRGWRERVELHDGDGDGEADGVRLTRTDFVRPRLERAAPYCEQSERTRAPRTQPFLSVTTVGDAPPDAGPDAGRPTVPSHDASPTPPDA